MSCRKNTKNYSTYEFSHFRPDLFSCIWRSTFFKTAIKTTRTLTNSDTFAQPPCWQAQQLWPKIPRWQPAAGSIWQSPAPIRVWWCHLCGNHHAKAPGRACQMTRMAWNSMRSLRDGTGVGIIVLLVAIARLKYRFFLTSFASGLRWQRQAPAGTHCLWFYAVYTSHDQRFYEEYNEPLEVVSHTTISRRFSIEIDILRKG